jgi:mRNA interferase RelE/StbE
MSYASEFTPLFVKLLKKLDRQIRERVLGTIEEILITPRQGSRLVYSEQVTFKWRVGDYRIVYLIDEGRKVVTFTVVDHRSRVYKRRKT